MKKIILFLILSLLSIQFCFAIVEDEKIDLEQAIKKALETNPQIAISKLDTEISKNDIKTAAKLQNPSLGTFQNMGKAGEENPQQIGASYNIEILKRGKRKELAQSNYIATEKNQKIAQINLILEVKKTYIDFLLKKSNLKIIKEQEELSKEILDNAIKNAREGKIPNSEVIQAKIEYNRAIMASNIISSQVVSAQNRFNSAMNSNDVNYDTKEDFLTNDYSKLHALDPSLVSIDFEKIKTYALSNRYDLLKSKQEIESAKNNLKVVKSQLIPDIEIQGGYGYQVPSTSASGKYLSGAYVGANIVNIPLVYRYREEIENAKLEIEKTQLKYKDAQIDASRNITDAWEKFSIAKDTLLFYNKELLSNSKELIDASKESLAKKEIDITTFLISKKLYCELMLGYQEALAEYYISWAELLKEINIPYDGFKIENL